MERTDSFVASKLALLSEERTLSTAQVDDGWKRVHDSVRRRSDPHAAVSRRAIAAAAAFALLAFSAPKLTAWGQSVWGRIILGRTANIRINLKMTTPNLLLPNVFPFYPQNQNQRWEAQSVAEASALAGFAARVLNAPSLPSPRLQVVLPPTIRHVFDRQVAASDLSQLGRALPRVPAGLDGADIRLAPQGKSVWSFYGRCPQLVGPGTACAMLIQSPAMALILPPAVQPDDYIRFSLELAGLPPDSARIVAAWSRTHPTLFLPLETEAELRRVSVHGREGTLMIYPQEANETAFVLDWHENGYSYRLYGRGPENAMTLAESIR